MKTVGIIGGLGPLAGAYFYRRVIELSPATIDEEHVPVILISDPTVPSRILHLSGKGPSPVPQLLEVCRKLVQAGAEVIALPSTTTSIYQAELQLRLDVPIVSLVHEVTEAIGLRGCTKIGVMRTTPTRMFAVYDNAFAARGIQAVFPDESSQHDIMEVIHSVKGAKIVSEMTFHPGDDSHLESLSGRIAGIARRPWVDSSDGILLGCTELPVLFPDDHSKNKFSPEVIVFSSTDILAEAVVRFAYGDDNSHL